MSRYISEGLRGLISGGGGGGGGGWAWTGEGFMGWGLVCEGMNKFV